MEVRLDKRYPVDAPAAAAWTILRDVRAVAGCMPGASITEEIDPRHYKGSVKVKVGPASAAFAGDIEVLALDEEGRRIHLKGKGADKGGSTATMDLSTWVVEADGGSELAGEAVIIVNGKLAQFGGRMFGSVSEAVLGQFAARFAREAAAVPAEATPAEDGVSPEAPAAPGLPPAGAGTPPDRELDALALLRSMIKQWFAGLFGRRPR
ncbi:MAG: SRPBCC family protein [Rhodocyclaceae bacterium]|nr:SRPBCC family protein [Rhodocyclaceae bacterium]